MHGTPRIFSREPQTEILLQRCRKCDADKDMVSYRKKHPHLKEPYCRATICNDCMKPIWNKYGAKARAKLKARGLDSHGNPYKKRKQHPWHIMGQIRKEAA